VASEQYQHGALAGAGSLTERLAAAGVTDRADPMEAWLRLRAAEGNRATIIDLYELVAAPQGMAAHDLPVTVRLSLARQAVPHMWPGFSVTDGSERSAVPLVVLEYNPVWPQTYAHWRRRIGAALGPAALGIEHVGSTSVPGLAAKPIVDIQVSVADLTDEPRYVPPLEQVGLVLRSRDEMHRYFRPPADQPRDLHVHVCAAGSQWERDHLLFRDYLRADPAACCRYAEAKRANVRRWSDDSWGYTEAKSGVILDILELAADWARTTAWTPALYSRGRY
jgi:GrpB-like predicted nucleotidyltransferase (UPF0157 family)